MLIPYDKLSDAALLGVIEEYVTRDGTDLRDAVDKVRHVRRALARGDLLVSYDEDEGTCNLLTPDDARKLEEDDPDDTDDTDDTGA